VFPLMYEELAALLLAQSQASFLDRFGIDGRVLWLLAASSVLMAIGAAFVVPILIVKMPSDYFVRPDPPRPRWARRHPILYVAWLILRNAVGLVFVIAGIIQLFTPGQGVLCILIGLSLMVFPGKRRVEGAIIANRHVLRAINAIRRRYGKEPILPPWKRARRKAGSRRRVSRGEELTAEATADASAQPDS